MYGDVVLWTGIGFLALAALTGSAWLIHAWWSSLSERRRARRRPAALAALATAIQGGDATEARTELARMPERERIGALVEMAFTVAGDQRARLNELAISIGVMAKANRWARSRRWGMRVRAARLLALFGGDDEPIGESLLRDPHPDVRAQATEWVAAHPTRERVELLLEMLDDPSPRCRFFARETLVHCAGAALDPLRARLSSADGLDRNGAGVLEVASALPTPEFAVPALAAMGSPAPDARRRGAALAGAVGGPEAARGLALLLTDPAAEVREEAARGLGRLGHWQSAAEVASLLEDPSWRTRRAAAAALDRMGPTGELFLRRTARSGTRGGDTAKHALAMAPAEPHANETAAIEVGA